MEEMSTVFWMYGIMGVMLVYGLCAAVGMLKARKKQG